MIQTKEHTEVVAVGGMETIDFTINSDNDKMFHLLSNLYSNPFGAVIREISTNCVDAHALNNNLDRPFHIIIPPAIDNDPSLVFRDFGPGMSHEDIQSIFTSFGTSTKTESNDFTGCLGLGSKSPFSISPSFTISSINQGIKTIYSATKNSSNIPQLVVFGQMDTEEENGLEIKIPLKSIYKHRVMEEILEQLKYFDVKPRYFNNGQEIQLDFYNDKGYYSINDTFKMKKNQYRDESIIIQSNIGYKFESENFLGSLIPVTDARLKNKAIDEKTMQVKETEFKKVSKLLENFSFRMFADSGTVQFMPSRENLIYDGNTVSYIYKELLKVITVYENKIDSVIQSFTTAWDQHKVMHKMSTLLRDTETLGLDKDTNEFLSRTFNGYLITEVNYKLPDLYKIPDNLNDCIETIEVIKAGSPGYENYVKRIKNKTGFITTFDKECDALSNNINIVIFNMHEYKQGRKHIVNYMKEHPKEYFFIFKVNNNADYTLYHKELSEFIGLDESRIIPMDTVFKRSVEMIEEEKLKNPPKERVKGSTYNKDSSYNIGKITEDKKERGKKKIDFTSQIGIKILTDRGTIINKNNQLNFDNSIISEIINSYSYSYDNISRFNTLVKLMINMELFSASNIEIFYLNKKDYDKCTEMITPLDFLEKNFQRLKDLKKDKILIGVNYKVDDILKNLSELLGDVFTYDDKIREFKKRSTGKINDLFYQKDNKLVQLYNKYKECDFVFRSNYCGIQVNNAHLYVKHLDFEIDIITEHENEMIFKENSDYYKLGSYDFIRHMDRYFVDVNTNAYKKMHLNFLNTLHLKKFDINDNTQYANLVFRKRVLLVDNIDIAA